jgi:hypothetical protein
MDQQRRRVDAERFEIVAPNGSRYTVIRTERQLRQQYVDGSWSNWAIEGGSLRTTTGLFVNEWEDGEYEVLTNPPTRPCARSLRACAP